MLGFPMPHRSRLTEQLAPLTGAAADRSNLVTTRTKPRKTNKTSPADKQRAHAARLFLKLQAMGYDIHSSTTPDGLAYLDVRTGVAYNPNEFIGFASAIVQGSQSHVRPEEFPNVARHFEDWAKASYFIPCDRDLEQWTQAQWPKPRLHGEVVPDNNPIRAAVTDNAKAVLPGLENLNKIYGTAAQLIIGGGALAGAAKFGMNALSAAEELIGLGGGEALAFFAERNAQKRTITTLQLQYLKDKILTDQCIFFRFMNRFYPGTSYDDASEIFAICGG